MWIATFTGLLLINLLVLYAGNLAGIFRGDEPARDPAFLDGADEVKLDWWPERISSTGEASHTVYAGDTSNRSKLSPVVKVDGISEQRDYTSIMRMYIRQLNNYLTAYYRITPRANGPGEE